MPHRFWARVLFKFFDPGWRSASQLIRHSSTESPLVRFSFGRRRTVSSPFLNSRSTEVQADSGARVQIAQLVGVADATINFAWYALRLCVNSISPDALAPFAVPGILLRR
jgi:hypothetical protein